MHYLYYLYYYLKKNLSSQIHLITNMRKILLLIFSTSIIIANTYSQDQKVSMSEIEIWKLGWRMKVNSMFDNDDLASLQFDSLRQSTKSIDYKYLVTGLEIWSKKGRTTDILELLKVQDQSMLEQICHKKFLSGFEPCKEYTEENVLNKALQIEIIKMYINDQYVRSNLMTDVLEKFNLKKEEVIEDLSVINTDEKNRERLKQMIAEYGFPTRKLVGKDAMFGIFLIIQHSDRDKEWQKSQLVNVEKAVKMGDMDGQSYAYVYDRIKINDGEKQLYGTQFANVDLKNKVAELAPTEDMENLDIRRMEMGIMPIEMYKALTLRN
jgi:hypothetical protein